MGGKLMPINSNEEIQRNDKEEKGMDWWAVAKFIIEKVLEHDAQIKDRKNIADSIRNAVKEIAKHIEDTLLTDKYLQLKGEFNAYVEKFEVLCLEHDEEPREELKEEFKQKFNDLADELNSISTLLYEYAGSSIAEPQFRLEKFIPLHQSVLSFLIALRVEMKTRFNYYIADRIILEQYLKDMLETQHNAEEIFCKLNPDFTSGIYPVYKIFNNKYVPYRKELERLRYVYFHNLNCDFQYEKTDDKTVYGGFNFNGIATYDGCTLHEIVENEGRRVLSVSNAGGDNLNSVPSIHKVLKGLPLNAEINFTMELQSSMPTRWVHLNIKEIDPSTKEIVGGSEVFSPTWNIGEWSKLDNLYRKQRDDTLIACIFVWHDNLEANFLIKRAYISYKEITPPLPKVEYNDVISILQIRNWQHTSTNKAIYFDIDDDVITTQYLAANDGGKLSYDPRHTPTIYQILGYWAPDWSRLNIELEVYLSTREPMDRKVQLAMYEIDNDDNIVNETKSEEYSITSEWKKVKLILDKKPGKVRIKFEIKWYDNNPIDIMVRDAKLNYYLK
ncbi:hypothetical protein COJ70_24400 [Priestia megaterium]|uniref:hypothetical protein n=1 Tax=Priestia megaterium TaxID=1404 RepID=UPI000BF7147B|nr:hypothetical protein [Priestia megaterium]PFO12713.1 hypothetical protein COJ70_24400 [Priestia megaterium]